MTAIDAILDSKHKPKEKVQLLLRECQADNAVLATLLEKLREGNTSARGTCMEAIELLSQQHPERIAPHLEAIVRSLGDKAPRVRWEAARVVGNLAPGFPAEAASALPALLTNTKDPGTVVRWSTAFALTSVAAHHQASGKKLLTTIRRLSETEKNNGVKKIYQKFLKQSDRG